MNAIITFFENIFHALFGRLLLNGKLRRLKGQIENDFLDGFLETLLTVMSLLFKIDKDFRRNIEGFQARYAFVSADNAIAASFSIADNRMKVYNKAIDNTNIAITFQDGKTLWEILSSGQVDIFQYILDNKISYIGNPNYVFKFGYLANHLRIMFHL